MSGREKTDVPKADRWHLNLRDALQSAFPYGTYEVNGRPLNMTLLFDELEKVAVRFGARRRMKR